MSERHYLLKAVTKLLTPLIVVFALYVQVQGEAGPGGGFQAGVLMAAALVGYGLVFGIVEAQRLVPPAMLSVLMGLGVALYVGTGLVGMVFGDAFLDHDGVANLLQVQPQQGQHIGIAAVEWGVFLTVSAALVRMYHAFAFVPEDQEDNVVFDSGLSADVDTSARPRSVRDVHPS